MSALAKLLRRASGFLAGDGAKSLTSMAFTTGGMQTFGVISANQLLPATKVDYAKEVGDGLGSSVLMAPLNWLMRTFPEAPPVVERRNRQKVWVEESPHPLTTLLRQPNPYYGGLQLVMATVLDLSFGNAYWLKIRNGAGEVIQLWWVPRYMMAPRWPTDGATFISHYDYLAGGHALKIDVDDVVHFRFGMDPRNIRLGLSPLASLVRDVAMDDQAANFATAILKNLGVIGIVVSPKSAAGPADKKALEETKKYLKDHFTGDHRGEPYALGAPTDVQLLNYNMQGFDVSPLRDVSEERVCAALGIPAAVVGFGTGLQQTKVGATMREMRQLAWTGGLMPMQQIVSEEIDRSLLSESIFDGAESYQPPPKRGTVRMRYDTSQVHGLMEETADKHNRVRADYLAGIITRGEARNETGRPTTAADNVFVQPVNVIQLGPDGKPLAAASSTASAGTPSNTTNATTAATSDSTTEDN